ncbi:hypothetical protein, partial [Tenacibaculum sp. 190130A14a]
MGKKYDNTTKSRGRQNILGILCILFTFAFTPQKVFSQGIAIIANETTTDASPSSTTDDGANVAGNIITYQVTVRNIGNVALSGVNVTLNGGTSVVSGDNLAVGQVKTYSVNYTITAGDISNGYFDNEFSVVTTEITTPVVFDTYTGSTANNNIDHEDDFATATIQALLPPDITITPPNAICEGDSFNLAGLTITDANSSGASYTYHTGTPATSVNELTGAARTVSPTVTTTYYVLATSSDGCVQEESVVVTVNTPVTAGSIGSDQTVCPGGAGDPVAFTSITDGTGGGTISYRWESSTDGSVWTDLGVSTSTYDSGALSVTTLFRRTTLALQNGVTCESSPTGTITVTVEDTTDPVVTGSITATTVEGCDVSAAPAAATDVAGIIALGVTSINDACDTSLTVSSSDSSTGTCPIVITRTYTITDDSGNSANVVHTINIDDTTAPSVTGSITATTVE